MNLTSRGRGRGRIASVTRIRGFAKIALLAGVGMPSAPPVSAAFDGQEPPRIADFEQDIRFLLELYCLDCHSGGEGAVAGVDLDRFRSEDDVLRDRSIWSQVFHKVEADQMPPPDRADRPTDEEQAQLLVWIEDIAARPDPRLGARDPGKPVLRRMTRLEYNNAIRDLFGLQTDVFMFSDRLPVNKGYFRPDAHRMGEQILTTTREFGAKYPVLLPSAGLPPDNRAEHGYRNRGDALNVSPLLLENYVNLARQIVDSPNLPEQSPAFRALVADPNAPSLPHREAVPVVTAARDLAPHRNVGHQAEGSAIPQEQFRREIASAFETSHGGVFDAETSSLVLPTGSGLSVAFGPDGGRSLQLTGDADLWLASFTTAEESSGSTLLTNHTKGEKRFTIRFKVQDEPSSEGPTALGVVVLGRALAGGVVAITAHVRGGASTTLEHTVAEGPGGNTFFSFQAPPGETIEALTVDGTRFTGDYVLLDDIAFLTPPHTVGSQPEPEADPRPSAEPTPMAEKRSEARDRLEEFLPRAFRRPVRAAEIERFLAIFDEAAVAGADFPSAMRSVLAGVLASPSFLYLAEPWQPDRPAVRPLDDHELASRLAFFLWASTPDDLLLELADRGMLTDPDTLEAQTLRMLDDPRIRELGESFATQWLRLDGLYTAKPDRQQFKRFYAGPQGKDTLHGAMLIEALLLFETVLVENRSILEFVDADYTWVNGRLRALYGLDEPSSPVSPGDAEGDGMSNRERPEQGDPNKTWRRVRLPDRTRGGYPTMAGPLVVTSLPTRTSPVKRGAWLLETILNRPPAEPKIAFALEEDAPATEQPETIRQRFEQHRSQPACFSCHNRLDPPGFALEAFDPIGAWRETDGGLPVDASGSWDGRPFDGTAGFKQALLEDREALVRGFVEHLLSYAIGRELEVYDRPAVAEIVAAAAEEDSRLRRVVVEIVKSYPFRHVRNTRFDQAEEP
ncbi:DUF1592 domain-containing protein [Tautonia rosea]|uniref:DUF1592 domain-containing protein n=1 Tax=Tautonia rosea TaxID=2728037 RepID=UPI001475FFE3|nr:DUF1592 domain-containing protein [Tautonia rosea]